MYRHHISKTRGGIVTGKKNLKTLTKIASCATIFIIAFTYTQNVFAKDMTSRLGIGYSDSFSVTMPSIAAKYYSSNDLAFSAALGIDTNSTNSTNGNSNFGLGGKIYKTVFLEENLNFYMGGGASVVSISPTSGGTGNTNSGFELNGFFGAEFFLPGIDSIGFNFQAGIGVTSLSSGVRFRTIGDTPLKAGMYFYF
jgi:hypothetical protein